MITAKDVIRFLIEDIDSEIRMQNSMLEYAKAKRLDMEERKRCAMASGMDYLQACDRFDYSMGYHAGMAYECENSINVLKIKRENYASLKPLYTEEDEENE